MCLIFVFKRKTAYEMRISDWSSDVCSSDLQPRREIGPLHMETRPVGEIAEQRAQEQGKRKGEKDRVKRMERPPRAGHGYRDHSVSSRRSEERRAGTACVSTVRSRWSPYN